MSTAGLTPEQQAAQAAAAAAATQQFNIEAWTLLGVGLMVTILRTVARVQAVGWKRLQVDDFLVWFAALVYAAETSLAYSVGHAAQGLANNGMTDEERAALSPESPEYGLRVLGSKIQMGGWTSYGTLLWALKGSLLVFYTRLTAGLNRHYQIRIYVGYGLIIVSYLVIILNLFAGCRPFQRNWQINPNPGNSCQPAVSGRVVWVYLAFNVSTDMYLLSIPLPMLWKSSLRPLKKFGLMFLFSGGIFVIACAILRCVLIVTDPVNGAQLAGSWAVRETFVAVVTTNMPMIFPLLHRLLAPCVGAWLTTMRSSQKLEETPSDLVTFGGGGGSGQKKGAAGRRKPSNHLTSTTLGSTTLMTNATFSESEERMVGDVKMQSLKAWGGDASSAEEGRGVQHHGGPNSSNSNNIQKQVEVAVVRQDRDGGDGRHTAEDQQRQRAISSIEQGAGGGGGGGGGRNNQGHFAFARGPARGF